jgi:aminopeptidase N
MATYLAFFAVGKYAVRQGSWHGLPWLVAVNKRIGQPQRTGLVDLLSRTPHVVSRLSRDLGPYPFSTTGGLVTALPVNFALENQTRPTYPAMSPSSVWLLVHELAHQWFGDSVAVDKWQEIWLNEGAATFMEKRWAETHGGVTAAEWLRHRYDGNPAGSSFWDLPIGDPGAAHIFDNRVYERGGMAMQALRDRLGGRTFWRVIRRWLADNAGGNGGTAGFEALAERLSGADLSGFFDAWLYTPAKPEDTVANGLGG